MKGTGCLDAATSAGRGDTRFLKGTGFSPYETFPKNAALAAEGIHAGLRKSFTRLLSEEPEHTQHFIAYLNVGQTTFFNPSQLLLKLS